MRAETLMILLKLSPEKIKRNHPFWKKLFETGINIEQKNIKFKRWKEKYKYLKNNWRFHKNIIIDFYSYLKLNFPNPIPFQLFFYCINESNSNTDYNEYREEEFDDFANNKTKHSEEKRKEELQFVQYNDDFYYGDYNNSDYEYDDYYYDKDITNTEEMIIDLADKWLKDILSGESFYEKNKDYFSKNEVKHFLTCDWFEPDIKLVSQYSYMDLLQYYWKIKIRANGLNLSQYFFVDKFIEHLGDLIVINYFKFICMNKMSIRDINEIYDIADFVFRGEFNGNLNNMTWQELKHMSDEWHEEMELQQVLPNEFDWAIDKTNENKKWKKMMAIKDFSLTVDDKIWTINEITTGKLLYEEGKDMHNCVFSYLRSCISGHCVIFSVKVNDKRMATLEIGINNSELQLIQAREKMNAPIRSQELKDIILKWSNENKINLLENFDNENPIIANNNLQIDNLFEDEIDYYGEYENADYEERLNNNIDIANNDNLLDNLEDEYYSRLYNKNIENDESTEKK